MKNYTYLYLCAVLASFGGLLSGFDTGVISGALLYINQSFEMNSLYSGLLVSSVSIGAVIGALLNGALIDKIGRRKVMLLTAGVFILGSVLCCFSRNIVELILSRMFIGCAVGVVSFAGPLYLSEISTKEKRGEVVSFHQLAITLGILFSYFVNYFCANLEHSWRIMFLLGAVPAVVLFFAMMILKDTPRWYVAKNKIDKAKAVLEKIDGSQNADIEIENIKKTLSGNEKLKFEKRLLVPFVIGIGIMFAQIATGINAIIYYAPTVFKMVGFSSNQDVLFATIFIGLINFLMTFVAIALVDKIGRKPLLYIGLTGMLINLLLLSFSFAFNFAVVKYIAVIACALYIVSFSMSLGPVALLLNAEIFPLKYRGVAMSIGIVSNFVFNFMVTGLFPISLDKLGGSITFLIFAIICVISLFFVYYVVPETKDVSLEEIENRMNRIKL